MLHTITQREETCGDSLTITIRDNTGPTLTSTLQTIATEMLDGTVVVCRAGAYSTSPQVGNVTIDIVGKAKV